MIIMLNPRCQPTPGDCARFIRLPMARRACALRSMHPGVSKSLRLIVLVLMTLGNGCRAETTNAFDRGLPSELNSITQVRMDLLLAIGRMRGDEAASALLELAASSDDEPYRVAALSFLEHRPINRPVTAREKAILIERASQLPSARGAASAADVLAHCHTICLTTRPGQNLHVWDRELGSERCWVQPNCSEPRRPLTTLNLDSVPSRIGK
jgi:hypothetical protein